MSLSPKPKLRIILGGAILLISALAVYAADLGFRGYKFQTNGSLVAWLNSSNNVSPSGVTSIKEHGLCYTVSRDGLGEPPNDVRIPTKSSAEFSSRYSHNAAEYTISGCK